MNRFFLGIENIHDDLVNFPPNISHQIARVLRLRVSEKVIVLDDRGMAYEVELYHVEAQRVEGKVLGSEQVHSEPITKIHLLVGLTQREKFEWILQKGTELGVSRFTPLLMQRCLVQVNKMAGSKIERWQTIVREAAEQSGRGLCPELDLPIALEKLPPIEGQLGLVLWEEEQGKGIRSFINGSKSQEIKLIIGPEGGITKDEIDTLRELGYQVASLGKRILRMETAAITAAAVVLFERGEMGG